MITAFCECVAGGCKKMALSPPLSQEEYASVYEDAVTIIRKHGLLAYHEENKDIPEEKRFDWILIIRRPSTLDAYLEMRRKGISPAQSLAPFSELLSYNPSESIHTGYDAYRVLFPEHA